jgi:hypothetical protein
MKWLIVFLMLAGSRLAAQSYEDSLFVYNYYHGQIDYLRKCYAAMDFNSWIKLADSVAKDVKLQSAYKRLNSYRPYRPSDILEIEGFGAAVEYAKPTSHRVQGDYSITYPQTRFIVNSSDKTVIPYYEEWHFNGKGELLYITKLNPTTGDTIK